MSNRQDVHAKPHRDRGITKIGISGYKSIDKYQTIEIRPLTILAGANSSGKSSMMQPLLLLKQTLEASYDPGPLLLNGPNIRFTSVEQITSKCDGTNSDAPFVIEIETSGSPTIKTEYVKGKESPIEIRQMEVKSKSGKTVSLRPDSTSEEITKAFPEIVGDFPLEVFKRQASKRNWVVQRDRCFLDISLKDLKGRNFIAGISPSGQVESMLRRIIHLPGLRGNPERNYPVTAVGTTFSGTFEKYFASVLTQWQQSKAVSKLRGVTSDLEKLGLTWKVLATPINDTQVEVRVGRLPHPKQGGARDLVSVADVGLGVSQTLPVVVALHAAEPGHIVYLEQPEIHLHPRAQVALAAVFADAARRGITVIVETHSSLLLLAVQTLVAEGKLGADQTRLHWFSRDKDGSTGVSSAELDQAGAYGTWPEDFAEVTLNAEGEYMDAAGRKIFEGKNGES